MNDSISLLGSSIDDVWLAGLERLLESGVHDLAPLVVTIENPLGIPSEPASSLRKSLDETLRGAGKHSTNTVANTIFPLSLWNPNGSRVQLYDRYLRHVFPAIKPENPHGTYFQRMIHYNGGDNAINQLEQVISTWIEHGNHRHSALQLSIFDPKHDHKHNRRLSFPCLHQVCFTPMGPNGSDGLAVTGFYATQHLVTKAYGNYMGLIRLGHFLSHALHLELKRMTCFSAKVTLGDDISKDSVRHLLNLK